jgi:adenylate kinase family enzyme
VVAEQAAGDRWIMDGNYGGTLQLRLASCDTVVFLDLPRRITIPRVILRRFRHRGRTRPEMAPDCPERLTWEFLVWIWTYPNRRRSQILGKLSALPADRSVWVLQSRRDVRDFVAWVESHGATPLRESGLPAHNAPGVTALSYPSIHHSF